VVTGDSGHLVVMVMYRNTFLWI